MVRLKYLGRTPKIIELPIPFVAKSEKTGQVMCNPVGEFTDEDAEKLIGICSEVWERMTEQPVKAKPPSAEGPAEQKKLSPLAVWQAKQRLIKKQKKEQVQQLEPSRNESTTPRTAESEGSQMPSP
jgi:hypothetical protein